MKGAWLEAAGSVLSCLFVLTPCLFGEVGSFVSPQLGLRFVPWSIQHGTLLGSIIQAMRHTVACCGDTSMPPLALVLILIVRVVVVQEQWCWY